MVQFVLTNGEIIDGDGVMDSSLHDDITVDGVMTLLTQHEKLRNFGLRCYTIVAEDGTAITDWQGVPHSASVLALTYCPADSTLIDIADVASPVWGQRSRVANESKRKLTPSQEQVWEIASKRAEKETGGEMQSPQRSSSPTHGEKMPFLAIGRLGATLNRDSASLIDAVRELDAPAPLDPQNESDIDALSRAVRSMIPADTLERLCEIGFSQRAVEWSLLENGLSEEAALNELLSAPPETERRTTDASTLAEWQRWYNRYKPSAHSDPKLAQLIDMGFAPHEARKYLRASGGNVNEAAAALLGDPNAIARLARRECDERWFAPVLLAVEAGEIIAQRVIEVATKFLADPQGFHLLWNDPKTARECRLLASLFENKSPPDT